MQSTIKRGREILVKKGCLSLLKRTSSYGMREVMFKCRAVLGRHPFTVGDSKAYFSHSGGGREVTYQRLRKEREELRNFIGELREDDVVLDVGANTGLYACFAASECDSGHVVAVEPYPPNVQALRNNLQYNGGNWTIHPIVLSDSAGEVDFDVSDNDDVGYGTGSISNHATGDTISVKALSGDSLLTEKPNVVKIDVEGSEPLVIDGLSEVLSDQDCRIVFCEVHLPADRPRQSIRDFGATEGMIQEKLEQLGFTVERISDRDAEYMLKGRKNEN